jgi:hypothetical protein
LSAQACRGGVFDGCVEATRLAAGADEALGWQVYACDTLRIPGACAWAVQLLDSCAHLQDKADAWRGLKCPAPDLDRAISYAARQHDLLSESRESYDFE